MRRTAVACQRRLFADPVAKFPSTRYQGSKAKLSDWIWQNITDLSFHTCLDAFGGTGAIAYRLKQEHKAVTYNDVLRFNHYLGLALIENSSVQLTYEDLDWLLERHADTAYPDFIERTFQGVYFTDPENRWLDQTITNIRRLDDPYKFALAFFALAQSCIIKRPYNLFHRKNLYVRLADVERSFGNKTTWDRPFDEWFRFFAEEANGAVFDNGEANHARNQDALLLEGQFDLVYIDTPYISRHGVGVDYQGFYHFLEGLAMYDVWQGHIDYRSKHRRLKPRPSPWTGKRTIHEAFDQLFRHYADSTLVVSYRSDGIPSEEDLISLLGKYKTRVEQRHFGRYRYVLSTNGESKEMLLIGT